MISEGLKQNGSGIYEIRLSSDEFLNYLMNQPRNQSIYRGISDANYPLIPKAYRTNNPNDGQFLMQRIAKQYLNNLGMNDDTLTPQKAEVCVLREFYELANLQGLDIPDNVSEHLLDKRIELLTTEFKPWLDVAALAQHYGLPTRLLDWTYDPFVAAYFASRIDDKKTPKEIAVWQILLGKCFQIKNLRAIIPKYNGNPNICAQSGLFVTYVGNEYSLEMPLDEIVQNEFKKTGLYKFKPETCLMIKIIIDASEIPQLKLKLENLGYNYSRIFPGYNGIAKQMIESSDDSR